MKKIRRIAIAMTFVFLLTACGSESEQVLTITLPSDTPKETIELIRNTVPALEKHLPGLFKYQSSLEFLEVRPGYPYWSAPGSGLPEDTTVTWLDFKVADGDKRIPNKYRAWGHRIMIGIEDSGKALILKKEQSQSVFLDRVSPNSGKDLVIKL